MTRRDALAGFVAATPAIAFGTQANSALTVGIIGTGGRGRYDGGYFAQDPRARVVALCDIYPDQIDRAEVEPQSQWRVGHQPHLRSQGHHQAQVGSQRLLGLA
jgi:hypothetical protein